MTENLQHRYSQMKTSDATWMDAFTQRRTLLAGLLIVIAVSVIAGAAEASHYQTDVLALSCIALIVPFVSVRPGLYVFALTAMLLVPYTWSPTLKNATSPAIILFALPGGLAGAAVLIRRGRMRLCIFDYLVMGLFVSALFSEIAVASSSGILGSTTLTHDEVEVILLPYIAFRLILAAWPHVIPKLPNALIITGAGLSIFAIVEEIAHTNLFAHSGLNNPNLAIWEHTFPRADGIRAVATMGHPIALGSFLVIPIVFAFGQRRWGLFTLLALGEALTLSRGPYIAVFVALLLCSVLTKRIGRMLAFILIAIILAASIGPVRNSVFNSFEAGTKEQQNADYRSQLLGTSLNSLSLWGKPTGQTSELFSHQSEFKLPDITSEFALTAGKQGAVGLSIWIGFLAAFIYVIREARKRADELLLLLGIALTGTWIALLSVALITSFQYAFWLAVAMAAGRLTQPYRALGRDGSTYHHSSYHVAPKALAA